MEINLVPRMIESESHRTLETIHFPAKESLLHKGCGEVGGNPVVFGWE